MFGIVAVVPVEALIEWGGPYVLWEQGRFMFRIATSLAMHATPVVHATTFPIPPHGSVPAWRSYLAVEIFLLRFERFLHLEHLASLLKQARRRRHVVQHHRLWCTPLRKGTIHK